jgi:DNA (cytosine-5)-methyltransferase 1
MLRLQGFPDTFKINVPYSQARKVAGNSVSVPVIKAIAGHMIQALQSKKPIVLTPIQLTLLDTNEYTTGKAVAG